jgi:hypothetical protein
MEIERRADREARLIVLVVSGELDDAGLLRLGDELEKAPERELNFSLLIDLRKASGQNVTSAGTRSAAARPLVLAPSARRAVVVPSELGFGMARMYEMLREGTGGATRVFRDYDEADRWVRTGKS